MNKSLAIIELYQHDEVLRHYCEMLEHSEYNIIIFCSKVVYDCLEDFHRKEKFNWEVQTANESIDSFLKRSHTQIVSADLVFITTVLSDFKAFYSITKATKTVLLIHNVHSFLAPDQYVDEQHSFGDRLRQMKLSFQKAHSYKKQLIASSLALVFPNEDILEYAKKKFKLSEGLKLISLPFAYSKEIDRLSEKDAITITIPGTFSTELRNYNFVLDSFLKLNHSFETPVKLVLLGKNSQVKIDVKQSKIDLSKKGVELITFNEFIAPAAYENWLMKSDFLILPLKEYGRNYIYKEQVGYSKISGSINDMIRFRIPALIPAHIPIENTLKQLTETFTQNDFQSKLEEWIFQKKYLSFEEGREAVLATYSKDVLQKDFLKKINLIFDAI